MSIPGSGLLAALRRKTQASNEPAATSDESKFAARSSAVHALEQAVATGSATEAARKAAVGCAVPPGDAFVYSLDGPHAGEAQPELTFAPVTRVPAEYKEANLRQIAVNEEFITYGLKQGHIRVLHRFSEARALLKGHTAPIADIAFVGEDLLAAGGQDGELYAWKLSVHDGDNAIHAEQVLHAKFGPGCDSSPVTLAPLAISSGFAVAVGNAVMIIKSSSDAPAEHEIDPLDPAPGVKMPNFPVQDQPTAISGSPDGRYIAAGSKHGRVYIAKVGDDGEMEARSKMDVAGAAGTPISAVAWLHSDENSATLLVSTASGTKQLLYRTTDDAATFVPGASVTLEASKESSFVHTQVVQAHQLVVMADTPRKQVYTLHWAPAEPAADAPLRFDYLARFKVGLPILNFVAMWNPDAAEDGAVELNCVQTEAVQQYFLDPGLCSTEEVESTAGAALMPAPAPSVSVAASTVAAEEASSETAAAPDASSIASATGEETGEEEALSDAAATLPPSPLINGAVTRSDSQAALKAKASEEEVCPSPPSSPAASTAAVVQVPVPVAFPTDALRAAASSELPVGEASVSPAPTPTKLLTPEDILRSTEAGAASTPPEGTPRATSSAAAPAAAGSGAKKILQRNAGFAATSAEVEAVSAAAGMRAAVGQPVDGTTAAPAAGAAAASSNPAVAAAVADEMSTVHRKFANHVSLMYKDLLKVMRTEFTTQNAANERLLRESLAAQQAAVAAERAAVLAEERANMERLLEVISTTFNRDIPAKLSEAMRTELASVSSTLAASMAPAIQQAVAAALPKETSAAVKAALDKQLSSSLQTGLQKPIQDAFRHAFTKQIVPSFENACQSMFLQMDKTFAKGLAEHTEASRSALSEPVALANSLRESLAEAARLTGGAGGSGELSGFSPAASIRPPAPVDIKSELRGLVMQGRYEEAFSKALGLQDVSTVGWLCTQADAASVLSASPPALSQMVLLSLVQQLAADIASGAANKLQWVREAALALNPQDPLLGPHLKPVLEQVHAALASALPRMQGADVQSCKLAMHVIHSQMSS